MGRSRLASPILVLFGILLGGCASAPPATTLSSSDTRPDYLRGVRSEYSVPIASLGDVDLLGGDSVMRDALVAGDADVVLAATAFEAEGVLTLDLVVLNRTERSLDLARSDLHLFDAEGRLIPQVDDVDAGMAWGLRGRGMEEADGRSVAPTEVFGPGWDADAMALGAELPRAEVRTKYEPASQASRREENDALRRVEDAIPVHATDEWRPQVSPRSVRVRPDDGKVFWAYFDGAERTRSRSRPWSCSTVSSTSSASIAEPARLAAVRRS